MSLICSTDLQCGMLQYCSQSLICQHQDVLSCTNPIQLAALASFSLFCGFASAGNYGAGAVQIVYLLLWMNYSRQEASAIAQPILVGLCLASLMRTRGRKHPLRNSSIIDYQLASLLLPSLLGSYFAALHLRYYLPSYALSIFIVVQILIVIIKTITQLIQAREFQNAHNEVTEMLMKKNKFHDGDHPLDDVVEQEDILKAFPALAHDQDDCYFDFQHIFKTISKSKYKDLYLAQLTPHTRKKLFLDLESDNLINLEEYINSNRLTDPGRLVKEQTLDEYIFSKSGIDKLQRIRELHEQPIVYDPKHQKNIELQEQKNTEHQIFSNIEQKEPIYLPKYHRTVMVLAKDVYQYPAPIFEILLILLVIGFNVVNFLLMSGLYLQSLINVTRCTREFWFFFGSQILGNYILCSLIFLSQKCRLDSIEVRVQAYLAKKQKQFNQEFEKECLLDKQQKENFRIAFQTIQPLILAAQEQESSYKTEFKQHSAGKRGPQFFTSKHVQPKKHTRVVSKVFNKLEPDDYPQAPIEEQYVIEQKFIILKGARVDLRYDQKSYLTIMMVGIFGGCMMGFVGAGTSLLVVMVIGNLRINLSSMLATLPMMVVIICSLGRPPLFNIIGSLIQIQLGTLEWKVTLFYLGLSFIGGIIFFPCFSRCLSKIKFAFKQVVLSLVFQIIFLIIYLYIWVPEVSDDFQKNQYSYFDALC